MYTNNNYADRCQTSKYTLKITSRADQWFEQLRAARSIQNSQHSTEHVRHCHKYSTVNSKSKYGRLEFQNKQRTSILTEGRAGPIYCCCCVLCMCVCVHVCACVRACVRACVCSCVRACVARACVCGERGREGGGEKQTDRQTEKD